MTTCPKFNYHLIFWIRSAFVDFKIENLNLNDYSLNLLISFISKSLALLIETSFERSLNNYWSVYVEMVNRIMYGVYNVS